MISALLDHLWQSTVFALGAGLLTLLFTRNGAHIRYWLWFAASVKFLIPFSLLIAAGSYLLKPLAPVPGAAPAAAIMQIHGAMQPFSNSSPVLVLPQTPSFDWMPILLGFWGVGAGALLLYWLTRWSRVNSALRQADHVSVPAPIPVKSSVASLEPGLVGIFKPVLILPHGIETRLTQHELNAIIAHEVSHWRRNDNLTAAIHMLVEMLFWFYPLVWWVGARLIEERERACDETVVQLGADPETYAEGILKVCRLYVQAPLTCTAGVSGAGLKKRVETIMANRTILRLGAAQKFIVAAASVAILAMPLVAGLASLPAAFAQEPERLTPEKYARNLAEQARHREVIAYKSSDFDQYAGYYQLGTNRYIFISREGDHFYARETGRIFGWEIYPESATKFFSKISVSQALMQFSFSTDAAGRPTGLVWHWRGQEMPAAKTDDGEAAAVEAALDARAKSKAADPMRETLLRRVIVGFANGQPAYADMSPRTANITRGQSETLEREIKSYGALKSVTLSSVDRQGHDIYQIVFERAETQWVLGALTADGKIDEINFSKTR